MADESMTTSAAPFAEGGCTCGDVRYRMTRSPLFVHCCHCTWCQRETGAAFALNALIETSAIELLCGDPEPIVTPTGSGRGQTIVRCLLCKVAVWSHYDAAREAVAFVRVGTLDDPSVCPPDIHIFTSSKQPWLRLDGGAPVMAEYYRRSEHWPKVSIERYERALGEKVRR